ncbi:MULTISPECIES: hypothetical protein [unclassified Leeuwenhoekiella]
MLTLQNSTSKSYFCDQICRHSF